MATETRHAPGTFCWPELATLDQPGAKKFYTSLFGWSFHDTDMGPDGTYTIFQDRDADVAALYTMREEEKKMAPPHWNSYVAVESADQTAAKVKQLGGQVIVEPFDVMDMGRMAVLMDPQGAVFQVWQAKKHGGARLNDVGSLCWTELMTTDPQTAETFYTGLFPWKTETMKASTGAPYTIFKRGGEVGVGGMMKIEPRMGPMPPHWYPYFAVSDCDATVAKATSLGARTLMPPTDIPNAGRFAVLMDPQNAPFAVIKTMPM